MTCKPIKLFLVRHGEATAHWGEDSDPGLSELGYKQASNASEELLNLIDTETSLVSSPMLRARQTSEPLAEALGASVETDDRFREIQAPVELKDRPAWIKTFLQQDWASQNESLLKWRSDATERLLEFGGCTVIFTHFMVLNAVVGQLLECPNILCFQPSNASITKIEHVGKTLRLESLGDELETVIN